METTKKSVGKPKERRLKIFELSKQFFGELFTEGYKSKSYVINKGIPKTGKIASVRFDDFKQCLEILVEDYSFDVVKEGDAIPVAEPILATVLTEKHI